MKIIEIVPEPDWPLGLQCPNCLSMLSVDKADLVVFDGEYLRHVGIICPVCQYSWNGEPAISYGYAQRYVAENPWKKTLRGLVAKIFGRLGDA